MRFYSRFLLLLCLLTLPPTSFAASLSLGIFPYISASKLLRIHKPVADYLAQQLDQPVNIVSAPGFPQFIQRTRNKKFDIIITAPHMGALAILQSRYQPLAVSTNRSHAVFLVKKSSAIQSLAQLKHAAITLPPQKAIISKLALQTLRQAGLNPQQLDIQYTRSHNNALESVLNDATDVAAIGLPTWNRASTSDKNSLRIIAESSDIPGFMVLANPDMDDRQAQKIAQALQTFHLTQSGKQYFYQSKLQRFRAINTQDIEQLKPFLSAIFNFKE